MLVTGLKFDWPHGVPSVLTFRFSVFADLDLCLQIPLVVGIFCRLHRYTVTSESLNHMLRLSYLGFKCY